MSRKLLRFVPPALRQGMRRLLHVRAIRRGRFGDLADPFYDRMSDLVHDGDWAIDVGAAVGDYAIRLSALVGRNGRVVALEPMPVQFDLLTSNACHAPHMNITCLQLAVGDHTGLVGMEVPMSGGAHNWYRSRVAVDGDTNVFGVTLDALPLAGRVSFIKIDSEGQDLAVLRGAAGLIQRDRPAILIEGDNQAVQEWLLSRKFQRRADARSTNKLYIPE